MSDNEFYLFYGRMGYVITEMDEKLINFKIKNRYLDTTKVEENIERLKGVQERFHYLWHENYRLMQQTGFELLEKQKLLNTIVKLKRENEMLKENIIL
jgi:hypothetical protein